MAMINFWKMHGAGNDFVLIDNRSAGIRENVFDLFRKFCNYHTGIAADGVMLLNSARDADFKVLYFNADGRPGEMCGNGARCAVALAQQLGMAGPVCRFAVWDRQYRAELQENGQICIEMSDCQLLATDPQLKEVLVDKVVGGIWLDTGVPHLVLEWEEELSHIDVAKLGYYYCHHERFLPQRTNVNFIVIDYQGAAIDIRTFERGVNRETLACGTGAVAAALYFRLRQKNLEEVVVHYAGGDLSVRFYDKGNVIWLGGPVSMVFEGRIDVTSDYIKGVTE